jgi:hypothetical protein
LVFGSVVHAAFEHTYRAVQSGALTAPPDADRVSATLQEIEAVWRRENPFPSAETMDDFSLTMMMAEAILPAYFKYWKVDDFQNFEWLSLEHEFKIPTIVTLPPAQVMTAAGPKWQERQVSTFLRGKMDGLYKHKHKQGTRLLETKTKGRIDPGTLEDILTYQLQPNIYMHAAHKLYGVYPVATLLNVVRRPQIYRRKAETTAEFAARLVEDIKGRPDFYFIRMELNVDEQDFNRFEAEFEDLLLDFVLWRIGEGPHYKNDNHCENKYGTCSMLPICGRKFYDGHFIRPKVFSELEEI